MHHHNASCPETWRGRTLASLPLASCCAPCSATRSLHGSPVCRSYRKHQSWCVAFEVSCNRITEGSYWFGILMQMFESTNQKRGHWLSKGPTLRRFMLVSSRSFASNHHLHSLVCPYVRRSKLNFLKCTKCILASA